MAIDTDAIIRAMCEESERRMAAADAESYRSGVAFESGHFESYWMAIGKEAEGRVESEYDAIRPDAETGDGGEPGGGESGPVLPQNGGDSPPQPAEEELPTPA